MFKLAMFVYYKYIIQLWMIAILSPMGTSLTENLFKKTAAEIPVRLDTPQRHQQHTVLELTDCARICSRSTSCVDLQYSNTSGTCITGHTVEVSDGRIYHSGLFDLYKHAFKDPDTCSDIKRINPTAESGEYFIHPSAPQFMGLFVKVYCLMDDTHQLEYVTLPNRNFGHYPKKSNLNCDHEVPYLAGGGFGSDGVTNYHKIRVQPSTMAVVITDTTFTTGNKTVPLQYGQADDCYTEIKHCKRFGSFHINTLGTRMRFPNNLTWTIHGYMTVAESISREEGGAIIDIVCGGYCGGCLPEGDMVLYPNTLEAMNNVLSTSP